MPNFTSDGGSWKLEPQQKPKEEPKTKTIGVPPLVEPLNIEPVYNKEEKEVIKKKPAVKKPARNKK